VSEQPVQYADAAHRYRLDQRIATGGMGVVWKSTDTRLDRVVAVKVLKHEYADDATFRTRFETEARHAAALHHPGICGVFDYSSDTPDGAAPYLVMEYVDGHPLSTLLAQAKDAGRTMDPEIVRDLMAQTAEALGVAHEAGIVHRDVKPANLMVTPDRRVKVTDFGIARAGDSAQLTRTGAVMGTPQYLSPEQARGNPSTPASDVYSLGCVAFECLSGRRPFEAETPVATLLAHLQQPVPQLPPSVPGNLSRVVTRALAKDPAERFPDGAAFGAALRNPSGAAAAPPRTSDRTAVLPAAAAGAAGAAAAGASTRAPMDRLDSASAYDGEEREERRTPWGALALVALLVVVAILIAVLLLNRGGSNTPVVQDTPTTHHTHTHSPSPSPTTSATQQMVDINADNYIGRDIHQVDPELSALGVRPRLVSMQNDGSHTPDSVAGVSPSGEVPKGSVVTVTYWGPAPATSAPATTSAPPPAASTPATTPPTTATTSTTGGNG